jgi:hypothetical protein
VSNWNIPLPESFTERRRRIDMIHAAGIEPPARWTELNTHLEAFLALEDTAVKRLAAAVVHPAKGTDLAVLRALALAEDSAGPQSVARINGAVVQAVAQEMFTAYEPVAAENYHTLAGQFDALAAQFTTAASTADPDAAATDMVTADEAARTAWVDAERLAIELDNLLTAMVAAAELAGVRMDAADPTIAQSRWTAPLDDGAVLALAVDPDGLHRRRVWEAWATTTGRTRRWGALVRLGARLRAADLDGFTPYRPPAPLIERQEQMPGMPTGYIENRVYDPEDPDYTPPTAAAGTQMAVVDRYR